jgi:hypothetical protein
MPSLRVDPAAAVWSESSARSCSSRWDSKKTTLLQSMYPQALWIDLLKAEEFRRYLEHPEYLRLEIPEDGPAPYWEAGRSDMNCSA